MISQKIYLVRHGQTDYNLQGIVQGSGIDASLNEKGKAQAQAFYDAYREISFSRVYTSRLKRSIESVVSFVRTGIPHAEHAELNEICWGNREGQRITPEEDAYYHWILKQWQDGKTSIRIEGGESPDEVARRQRPFLELLRTRDDDGNVLICMHGRAMRILLCQLLHYPLRSMDMFEHANLGLYLLHHTGTQFSVGVYNNVDHLAGVNAMSQEVMTSYNK